MTLQPNPDSPNGQLVDDENSHWYIHGSVRTLTEHGVTVGEVRRHWVDAEEFMRMQAERDELRRTLAMINGVRVHNQELSFVDAVRKLKAIGGLCERAGFTERDGHAHNSLLRYVNSEMAGIRLAEEQT